MQAGRDGRVDDAAEARPEPDLAHPHRVEAAPEIEGAQRDRGGAPEALGRHPHARQDRRPVAQPDPLRGHGGPPEAHEQEADHDERRGDVDPVGNVLGGPPEARGGVQLPAPVDPVEGVPGAEAQDRDGRQVDQHHPAPQELQEHDERAQVGGGAREEEHERGTRAQALQHERRRDRRRRRRARVDRDPEQEHQQHRAEPAAEVALDHRGREQDRDERRQADAEGEPVRGLVEEVAEGVGGDLPPAGEPRAERRLLVHGRVPVGLCRPREPSLGLGTLPRRGPQVRGEPRHAGGRR